MNDFEHQHQCEAIRLCDQMGYPYNMIFAIPNGGKRNIGLACKLKKEGVRTGIPDLFWPLVRPPFAGLFIELKASKGVVSDEQRSKMRMLEREGYMCAVCFGSNQIIKTMMEYVSEN